MIKLMCNLRYRLLTWVIRGVDWGVSLSITCCLLNRCGCCRGNCRWYRSTVAFLIAKVSRTTLVSAIIRSAINTFLKQKQRELLIIAILYATTTFHFTWLHSVLLDQ